MDKDTVILLAPRAARLENQDAIDASIVNMLADPKEVDEILYSLHGISYFLCHASNLEQNLPLVLQARANIKEVHFLPFNPVEKRTAITYIDSDGAWYRASKGAPEQVHILFLG